MVNLGDVCSVQSGGTPSTNVKEFWENGNIPWLGSAVCKNCIVEEATDYITEEGFNNSSAKLVKANSTLIALVGATIGKVAFLKFEATTNQNVAALYPNNSDVLSEKFLFYACLTLYNEFLRLGDGKFRMANLSFVKSLKIPLPPIKIQEEIVQQLNYENTIVEQNKVLIRIFEKKISDKISEVWGE